MKLLLQQQPVAKDLRQISSALKMITDMKRIGNQVENIVELATNLDSTYAENYLSIGRMAESTIRMVKLSIQAFVNKDLEMAKEAKLYDDIIDVLMIAKYFELEVYLQNLESGCILKERKCPIHLVVSTFV